MSAYAASKAAIDKFVRDSANTLKKDGILINLLDPGWLRTDLGGPNAPNAMHALARPRMSSPPRTAPAATRHLCCITPPQHPCGTDA
jgi:NAD(P)-dependent dehydrogenase (short-subunit alcohol dehydrogenase family)